MVTKRYAVAVSAFVLAGALFMGMAGCSSEPAADDDASAVTAGEVVEGIPSAASMVLEPGVGCSSCHGVEGFRVNPADHDGRTDDMCMTCHKLGEEGADGASPIPHTIGE